MGKGKKKEKWYKREAERRISRYQEMSDDEFLSVYKKEMAKGISISASGILIVIGCIVVLVLMCL